MLTNIENQSQCIKISLNQHENIFGIEGANITRSNIQVVDDGVGLSIDLEQMVR
jgi:hypothetical protein